MKILHISKYYEPFKGGIEKVILELASGSVKQGHEVVVLSSNVDWRYKEDMIEGVKVIRLPRAGVAFSQPMTMSFLWKAKKWMEWADVVQVHTPNPLAELSFLWQDNQVPLIATYHCDVVRQKKLYQAYKPICQKLLNRADRITVSTPLHLEYSELLQDHKHKAVVIPFGVRAKHAKRTPEINENLKKIKDQYGDYFLFIGRLVPYKGVDILLHAMKEIRENLVIVGQGPRWESWHALAKELHVDEKVHFLGRVDDDAEFAAYLHGCHSLVLPSVDESEAFGIVLIEAMSCGSPVITTNLKSGVPWVNDQGVTGLQVEPGQADPLAQALKTVATDHELRYRMGEAAKARFQKLFQVETMVQAYIDLYADCVPAEKVA
ncbi:MAG: glycosyltransferase, partial [Pseudomonadota bacterium]